MSGVPALGKSPDDPPPPYAPRVLPQSEPNGNGAVPHSHAQQKIRIQYSTGWNQVFIHHQQADGSALPHSVECRGLPLEISVAPASKQKVLARP